MTDKGPTQPDYRRRMEAAEARVAELEAELGEARASIQPWKDEARILRAERDAALGPFRCCDCCPDGDPDYHAENPPNSHSTWCTACHASPARLLAAEAREQALRDRVAAAAKHPHKGPNDTDASMLTAAAKRIRGGYEPGGSWTKQTVANVLDAVAALLSPPTADTMRCKCGHAEHFHWKAPTGYACNAEGCGCTRYKRPTADTQPEDKP